MDGAPRWLRITCLPLAGVHGGQEEEEEMCMINPLLGVITSAYRDPIHVPHQRTLETHQTSRIPAGIMARLT